MIPNPVVEFARRIKGGREWYVQYMLASFVLGTGPTKMNTGQACDQRGAATLAGLERHAFGETAGTGEPKFFWEYRLSARDEDPSNGWPDLAAEWGDRLLMVELKTEAGSVRDGQVDWYLDLAAHHFPDLQTDLLFITRDPVAGVPPLVDGQRYATANWLMVADAIEAAWSDADPPQSAATLLFADYLRTELSPGPAKQPSQRHTRQPSEPRQSPRTSSDSEPNEELVVSALATAAAVEADHQQRALEWQWASVEGAQQFAAMLRSRLRSPAAGDPPAPHVSPWVARPGKSWKPMTDSAGSAGCELRFSFYPSLSAPVGP